MVRYIYALNLIKNAILLKKKTIKIKKTTKTGMITQILKNVNIILNVWDEKNYIIINLNNKKLHKIKITFLKKNLKKKESQKELKNSSSIFLYKNNTGVFLLKKNLVNSGGLIFARIDF